MKTPATPPISPNVLQYLSPAEIATFDAEGQAQLAEMRRTAPERAIALAEFIRLKKDEFNPGLAMTVDTKEQSLLSAPLPGQMRHGISQKGNK